MLVLTTLVNDMTFSVGNTNKELPFKAVIGKAMQKLRGKASGKKIAEFLRKNIS